MEKGALSHLAQSGATFTIRATPRARRAGVSYEGGVFRITVTAPAEDGRANDAVRDALAHALGVAKSRLTLTQGATSRDKVFRLD